MKKFFKQAVALAVLPVIVFASPALALVQSSVEGGDIFYVKNVTKNIDYNDPLTADSCNVLQYRVRVHNPGPTEVLSNVTVVAAFGNVASNSNVSIATVRADNAAPASTSDTATVSLSSSQTVSYINGSTQLLDANGNVLQNLSDGITGNGVSIGNVGVSIGNKRYVQFRAQVSCPAPAPTPTPAAVTPVVTTTAKALPNTGPGDVLGIFAGASGAGTIGHYFISRRRK